VKIISGLLNQLDSTEEEELKFLVRWRILSDSSMINKWFRCLLYKNISKNHYCIMIVSLISEFGPLLILRMNFIFTEMVIWGPPVIIILLVIITKISLSISQITVYNSMVKNTVFYLYNHILILLASYYRIFIWKLHHEIIILYYYIIILSYYYMD
jgi:hypothetical protein